MNSTGAPKEQPRSEPARAKKESGAQAVIECRGAAAGQRGQSLRVEPNPEELIS
jgi:hypothetical protein